MQKSSELLLVRFVLVNVGDAQLRLPVKWMRRALENLLLLGDRREHHLQRRPFEVIAKLPGNDAVQRIAHAAPDRTERLHPLRAAHEPGVVN